MNIIKFLLFAGALALSSVVSASEIADSVRLPHRLREVEVLGNKQSADAAEAVTRISGTQARRLGIANSKGIAGIAPNVYMPDYGSRMTSSIYVRGLGARIDQPVMGLMIDNVPVMNKDAYDFDIADIASIEVLRGAQAVLNGRNTMGGLINIRTLSPLTTKGLRLSAEYGNGNSAAASAAYYGLLRPQLGMSLAAQFRHTDGFFTNSYDGSKLDHENSGSVRWKTAWRPRPALSLSNTAAVSVAKQGGYPYKSVETGSISYNDTCSYRRTFFSDGLTVAWAGKRVVVTSLTSVQYIDDDMMLDQDFTPEAYFTLRQKRHEWNFTEDLFTRGSRGAYSWLGGVFAFYRHTRMEAPVTFKDTGIQRLIEEHRNMVNPTYPVEWDTRSFTLGSDFTLENGGFAIYHESAYKLDKWRFEAGLRLDIERPALSYRSRCNTGFSTLHILPDGSRELFMHTDLDIDDCGDMARTFVEFLPKLTVAGDFGHIAPYFTFAKAYKAGGYNTQMFSDVLQQRIMGEMGIASPYKIEDIVAYEPEYSFNYEIGFHSRLFDSRLMLDGLFFYIDCRNQQLTTFPAGTTTGRVMTNAGRTRSYGFEITSAWHPYADFALRASYGFTNATFRHYNDGHAEYRGNRLPYAPANTLFAEADYTARPLAFNGITPGITATVNGAGNIYWNEANSLRQPFYATASLALRFVAEHWNLQLWCRNLTSANYDTFYFLSIGNAFTQSALPRTFGATLRINI